MMKWLLFATASAILLVIGLSTKTYANETTANEIFNLARNGYFEDEGIPSHGGLTNAYRLGNVTAEDLVNAAIQQNRLSPEMLENERFLRAINQYLLDDANGD
ncbi:hypothetical protein H6G89_29870 [Oscillatoria sp. FACHB-1407]|uniref:hypothetical protein n=1 Tax=Oscillatoria sp. FACHB-1407 TaxID=2692847 RepID=UPI00168461C0|nr:hypothetical protein [Oscillatoria sp. FACHB-1407]MBD2465221.1 hypothetical protein [Oscillatoria sp. FACHB-1407]